MRRALARFEGELKRAREHSALYAYLTGTLGSAVDLGDLLRFQWVHAVSALDRLVHDVVRVGMLETFTGKRPPTKCYLAEAITMEAHAAVVAAAIPGALPPPEVIFEHEIVRKISTRTFQDPRQISEALSLLCLAEHRWAAVAQEMGMADDMARTRLKLIKERRNAIVHEADIDPVTGSKRPISADEASETTDFVGRCGTAIVRVAAMGAGGGTS